MGTATIEKGSKVRVTFEAEYEETTALGRHTFKGNNVAPADAKVDIIAPPLPKEPGVGSLVKPGYANAIYKRAKCGWWKITGAPEYVTNGNRKYDTWEQLNSEWGRGELVKLGVDQAEYAADMKEKPYTMTNKGAGLFVGEMTAQVVGYDVVFKLPCGDKVTISDYAGRELALAILKATGGQ